MIFIASNLTLESLNSVRCVSAFNMIVNLRRTKCKEIKILEIMWFLMDKGLEQQFASGWTDLCASLHKKE